MRALARRWGSIVVLLAAWEIAVLTRAVDPAFLPAVHTIAAALWDLLTAGEIWINLLASTYRAVVGLAIGTAVGVVVGLLMATSRAANGFFGPLVAMTYSLPKASLVPLFILWFGIGDTTNMLTVFLATLLPVVVSTYHGVKAVPQVLVWSAQAMGTPRAQILRRILIPASLLSILTGMRIALGFSWVLTISAEMIAAKTGIGKLIFLYGENGSYAHMFAGILAIVAVAYAADRAMVWLMHAALHWHDSADLAGRALMDTAANGATQLGRAAWRAVKFTYPIALVVLAWALAAHAGWARPLFLPSPRSVAEQFWPLLQGGEIVAPLFLSLYRAFGGLVIALVIGAAAGVAMARTRWMRWGVDPLVSVAFPAPKIAFMPIFILWFGIDSVSKILLVAFTCVFPIIVATYHGATAVSRTIVWSAQAMGTSERELLRRVILPATLPYIFSGLRVTVPVALITAYTAEMVAGGGGLGAALMYAQRFFQTPSVFLYIILMLLSGVVLDQVMLAARVWLIPWQPEEET